MKKALLFVVAIISMFALNSCEESVSKPYHYAIGIGNTKGMAYGNERDVKLQIVKCGAVVDTKLTDIVGVGVGEANAQASADEQAIVIFNQNADKIDVTDLLSIFVDGASFDYILYRVQYSSTPKDPAVYTPVRVRTFKK